MSNFKLEKSNEFKGVDGSLLFVIMDGVGLYRGQAEGYEGNAFDQANTPNIDRLMKEAAVSMQIKAHGKAVGLPSDSDMGNSEVGHNAMGAGRVFSQGARLVNDAISSGSLYQGNTWKKLVQQTKDKDSTFHLLGLLSDGNVHSHVDHLYAIIRQLEAEGVKKVRIHPLADGRDVDPVTYHLYIEELEKVIREVFLKGCNAKIASGGGRMSITMDRYNANWDMVQKGWETHVVGRGKSYHSAEVAIDTLRENNPGVIDQDLPAYVISDDDGNPVGKIVDGDVVVFFNFRGDRAIEISRAFTEENFSEFSRMEYPEVAYAGMMQYDGDLNIPPDYLVEPPAISKTVSEYLAKNNIAQLAISETQKFGHVTYFWNGNNSAKFSEELEEWIEIKSDVIPFEQAPAMKAYEISERLITELESGKHKFLRVNFPNGDMVGHTGDLKAAIKAMEVLDECIGKLEQAVNDNGATMIITADHGNSDMMLEVNKKTGEIKLDENGNQVLKTSHTLSPVPWMLTGKDADKFTANTDLKEPGLANIASTLLLLLGFEAPENYYEGLIKVK